MRIMNYAGGAVALLALAGAPLCVAGDNSGGVRFSSHPFAAQPAATAPAMIATSVTVGYPAAGVPCYQCDPLLGFTIAIPIPLGVFNQADSVDLTVQYEDLTFTGPCFASYALVQGTTAVAHGSYQIPGGCQAGFIGFVSFPVTIPATPGGTKVTGTILYGTAAPLAKTASTTAIFIQ